MKVNSLNKELSIEQNGYSEDLNNNKLNKKTEDYLLIN